MWSPVRGGPGERRLSSTAASSRSGIVGVDRLSDLAVLRADGNDLVPATLGEAERLRVGQLVVFIGNPTRIRGLGHGWGGFGARTFSSPRARERAMRYIDNMIQTDAALNPGTQVERWLTAPVA